MINALLTHILGRGCSPEVVQIALQARHETPDVPQKLLDTSHLFGDWANEAVVESAEFAGEEDVAAQYELLKQKRQRHAEAEEQRLKALARIQPAPADSETSGGVQARKFYPLPPQGLSQEEAQTLFPDSCRISKDDRRENRWRLRSKLLASERSKSFGKGSGLSVNEALLVLLQVAWRAEEQATGRACPWQFEDLNL